MPKHPCVVMKACCFLPTGIPTYRNLERELVGALFGVGHRGGKDEAAHKLFSAASRRLHAEQGTGVLAAGLKWEGCL